MAAASPTASALPTKVVIKTEPDSEEETEPEPEDVAQLREPVVPLLSPVCGLQPLLWSQDHRLAVSTTSAVSVIELRCDIQSPKQQLTLHRTAISVTQDEHRLQRPKVGVRWKPMQEVRKRLVSEEEEEAETTTATTTMDGEEDMQTEGETQKEREGPGINRKILLEKEEDLEEHKSEVQAWINSVETHLMRENMKRVLGTVYLNFVIAHKASIPTCGLVQYLSTDNRDRDAEVLIGHIKNKLYKQTFREHCSLCEEVLPFDDYKQATCANGHVWPRCGLSYQACQAVTFRRCLLLDSISRLPEPEDPVWIQKMLQAPCALCDSPFI
ncbi:general transcription factor 3C polypeptide 4 isoform X2 [Periophthalmus magnuspinnatus]|uniref:general transcription factor 3C polypeptide 4 isoform X2 n=1 Tax=Periophthalmus magnuspinnatus TaxID=409849 RepID=UPI002437037D|nr:general transcription factor 3C polypeptide 4 isoform X2 [Periophthalmus magnuspinnatus]